MWYPYLGQKFIHEDKVSYFNALKYERQNCEQFPAFDDEPLDREVSMEIEEAKSCEDDCYSEDGNSQHQGEDDFKLQKAHQRLQKYDKDNQVSRAIRLA